MPTPDHQNLTPGHIDPDVTAVSIADDAWNGFRGFCMGAADTIPGVSGGTVALILGHYERLVGAISRVDRHLFRLVFSGQFSQAKRYLDARFLFSLGCGIATGIVTLTGVMHWLLDHRMPETFAVFFGLILASVLVVRRYITRWTPLCYLACLTGVGVALLIGRLSPSAGSDSLAYLFGAATIAICAMILPGISGAFILLLFGVYHQVTGLVKNTVRGDIELDSLIQLAVFAAGCLVGLLTFSRLLRWLLLRHKSVTMSALIGLMLGSVEKLWPLQVPTAATAGLEMKERVMQNVSPADWPGSLAILVALAVAAAAAVLLLERIANVREITVRGSDD